MGLPLGGVLRLWISEPSGSSAKSNLVPSTVRKDSLLSSSPVAEYHSTRKCVDEGLGQ